MSRSPESVQAPVAQRDAASNEAAQSGSLPVPVSPLRSELTLPRDAATRPSLWKRIRMRKQRRVASESAPDPQLATQLDTIEEQIRRVDSTLREQLEAVHRRLDEVWESEEQLSQLADMQDKLDRLARSHAEITNAIKRLRRTITTLSLLALAAAAAFGLVARALFQ